MYIYGHLISGVEFLSATYLLVRQNSKQIMWRIITKGIDKTFFYPERMRAYVCAGLPSVTTLK